MAWFGQIGKDKLYVIDEVLQLIFINFCWMSNIILVQNRSSNLLNSFKEPLIEIEVNFSLNTYCLTYHTQL